MVWVANALADNNFDVTFLTYRENDIQQPLSQKVKYIHRPLEPISGTGKGIFKSVIAIRKFIKKEKFDIAIAFLSPSQLRLSLATIGLSTKLLFSHRGDPFQKATKFRFGAFISQIAFKRADMYVFQTDAAKNYYSERIRHNSVVICNPVIPIKKIQERKENKIEDRIVNVARLDIKQKRQDLLIKAFNLITNDYPDIKLEFYGDGPDLEELKKIASGNSRIIFKGKTSDVRTALQNARLFILSSDFEGIPNALLESMSAGIPSISTDCSPGGAAMLINSYENGILVPRNDINELANAMKYMLDNVEEAERMGANAKEVNQLFSEEAISKKWTDFIESSIKS